MSVAACDAGSPSDLIVPGDDDDDLVPDAGPPDAGPVDSCEGAATGDICTLAGSGRGGFDGDGKGRLESALFWPLDLEFDPQDGTPYILDWNNHRLRRINDMGTTTEAFETVMGQDEFGDGDRANAELTLGGALATDVLLNHPTDALFLPNGRLAVSCWHNFKIREIDLGTGQAFVSLGRFPGFAGDGTDVVANSGDDPAAILANEIAVKTNFPVKLALDAAGNLYFADQRNMRIRKVSVTDGRLSTVVGTGTPNQPAFAGDGGDPTVARLGFLEGTNPEPGGGLAIQPAGRRLFISDTGNNRIRMVDFTPSGGSPVIVTIAGTGAAGYSGDGGDAREAELSRPRDIEVDPIDEDRLVFAEADSNAVREIRMTFDSTTGDFVSATIDTVAGTGVRGFSGDGGPANQAQLSNPFGVAFDGIGDLYIADTLNFRIRRVLGGGR